LYLKYLYIPVLTGDEMFFASYGKFMHSLIESYYKNQKSKEQLVLEYLCNFREQVQGEAPSEKVYESYFKGGLEYLKQLEPPKFEVMSIEQKAEFSINGNNFVCFIDLIGRDSDGLFIEDHKSRILKPKSGKENPTSDDDRLDEYLTQLYLYSAAVKLLHGAYPSKLRFNCYRAGSVVECEFNENEYKRAIRWVLRKIEQIKSEKEFKPKPEYFKCRYLCEMHNECEYYG
jgi:ATP-dependent exoDNAse (exonuclease V) beta subunit